MGGSQRIKITYMITRSSLWLTLMATKEVTGFDGGGVEKVGSLTDTEADDSPKPAKRARMVRGY